MGIEIGLLVVTVGFTTAVFTIGGGDIQAATLRVPAPPESLPSFPPPPPPGAEIPDELEGNSIKRRLRSSRYNSNNCSIFDSISSTYQKKK